MRFPRLPHFYDVASPSSDTESLVGIGLTFGMFILFSLAMTLAELAAILLCYNFVWPKAKGKYQERKQRKLAEKNDLDAASMAANAPSSAGGAGSAV